MKPYLELLRSDVRLALGYEPGEQPQEGDVLKLNTNENPYGPSPAVGRAIRRAIPKLRRYPDPGGRSLCAKIAQVYGIPEPSILLANGSDEAIRLVFEALLEKGDTVVIPHPTYTLYEVLARFRSATVLKVPFGRGFTLPPLPKEGKLLILPHPHVPSGVAFPLYQLEALVGGFKGLVVLDEAYVDFGAESAIPFLGRFDNVAIVRTFSKSFSLAGLRVGFIAGPTWLIEALNKLKDSYNVGWLAQAGALAALEDIGWMELNVKRIVETREFTRYHLLNMGFHVPESSANFLLAQKPGLDQQPLYEGLKQRNVLVRHFPTDELYDCIRVSIGTSPQMEFFLETLRKILLGLK